MDAAAFDMVRQLAAGHYLVGTLHGVARLGVADRFDGTIRVADLAAASGADPGALRRALRLLASRGIFVLAGEEVGHTEASRLLREDHPASLRPLVLMFAQEVQWQAAVALPECLATGEAATPRRHEGGLWGYYAGRPDEARIFDAAMRSKAVAQVAGILASYDFSLYPRIVDIGGGQGHLLRAILAREPAARGLLFDQPAVIEAARAAGGNDRLAFESGDFFRSVPAGDLMILMEVIHDWDDAAAGRILRTVRAAAPADARLLVIETEVPEGNEPHWSKLLDLVMLAQFASLQRTREDYRRLLAANGFAVSGVVDTGADISIIEARPV